MCLYLYDLTNKFEVQIFRICGHTTRLPKIWLMGPYRKSARVSYGALRKSARADMADSPDFFSSEIRGDRFLCSHCLVFGDLLKKVSRLEKSGSGTTALRFCFLFKSFRLLETKITCCAKGRKNLVTRWKNQRIKQDPKLAKSMFIYMADP